MQIHEITKLNENALGAFGAGFAQGAGINVPSGSTGGNNVTTPVSGYGQARQQAAVAAAKPLIAAAAKREMQGWNMAIADMIKQEKVQTAAQLSSTARDTLKRNLWDRLHKVLMQGKLGTNYIQSLPSSVDKISQPAATKIVNQLNAATQAIMNFKRPADDAAQQLMQWTALAQTAYDAMSLTQFNPAQRSGAVKRMPKISGPDPDGSYRIGNTKINPLDPVGNEMTQKIQAAQEPNSNQVPIVSTPDGFRIGKDTLDPRNPVDAKMIEMIQAVIAAEAGATA
jgi:hypothetical protein